MKFNYHHLFYFWQVAHHGSFTRVAELLKVSQSAVSEQVKQLEDHLQLKLFERSKRRSPVLTDDGKQVYAYADKIFRLGEELGSWSEGKTATLKTIRIGALSGLSRNFQLEFMRPLLKSHLAHFEIITGDFSRLKSLLENFKLDVVLTTQLFNTEEIGHYSVTLLGRSPLAIVEAPQNRRRQLKDKLNDTVFLPSAMSEIRPVIDSFLMQNDYHPQYLGEMEDVALLRLMAIHGDGVAILPKVGVLNEIKNKTLKVIYEFDDIHQSFYAIARTGTNPNPEIQKLIQNFHAQLKSSKFFTHD